VTIKPSHYLATVFFVLLATFCYGQIPSNDLCENASEIVIPSLGLELGEFVSDTITLTYATRTFGETCAVDVVEKGNCEKTIWFSFQIGSTRDVSIAVLKTDTSNSILHPGITLYKASNCGEVGRLSLFTEFISHSNQGTSGHTVLPKGKYFVQVSSRTRNNNQVAVKINIRLPNVLPWDSYLEPYILNSESYSNDLNQLPWVSVEKNEAKPSVLEEYSKSIWVQVNVPKGTMSSKLWVSLRNSKSFLYRVFKGGVSVDSFQTNENYHKGMSDSELVLYYNDCKASEGDTLLIQLLFKEETHRSEATLRHNFKRNEDFSWGNRRTPVRDILFAEDAYSTYPNNKVQRVIGCVNTIESSDCDIIKSLDYSIIRRPDTMKLKYAGFIVLDIRDTGVIRLVSDYSNDLYVVIFKGDISNSCNVTEIGRQGPGLRGYCAEPGFYTLLCFASDFNQEIAVRYDLIKAKKGKAQYTTPETAEKMGDFNPLLGETLHADYVAYPDEKTTTMIDGVYIPNQRITYRELNIVEGGSVNLQATACRVFVFKGSIVNGTAKRIKDWNYSFPYLKAGLGLNKTCLYLEQGLYTFVCVGDGVLQTSECESMWHKFQIKGLEPCPDRNDQPTKAIPINNNNNILEVCDTLSTVFNRYAYNLYACADCYTRESSIEGCLASSNLANGMVRYYTFFLPRNMTFGMSSSSNKYILYEGDATRDPEIVNDENKQIPVCNGDIICNLEGQQIYTIAVYMTFWEGQSTSVSFTLSDIRYTVNDFISNSIDLGHFSVDTIIYNDDAWITCHTNGLASEICFQLDNQNYYANPKPYIPFVDSVNRPRTMGDKTIWYTFYTEVPYSYTLDYSYSSAGTGRPRNYLLKYNDEIGIEKFEDLLSNGFDTSLSLFKLVNIQHSSYNKLCEPGRYFMVIVFPRQSVTSRQVNISLELKKADELGFGDNCVDAIELNIDTTTVYKTSFTNHCNTYGDSPFEEYYQPGIASTWFKLNIRNEQPVDLQFTVPSGYTYSLFGGDCGGLTPIAKSNKMFSYFTAGCLKQGSYYLQVIGSNNSDYLRELSIQVTERKAQCMPVDYFRPLASFQLKGGCGQADTVKAINTSTQGEHISYKWYLNNQLMDTSINYYFTRKLPNLVQNNMVKLIVSNRITKLNDTFSVEYKLDTAGHTFDIIGKEEVFCDEDVTLRVQSSFPHKIQYAWKVFLPEYNISQNLNNTSDSLKIDYLDTTSVYIVEGEVENCVWKDAFRIMKIKPKEQPLFNDTFLCLGDELLITRNDNFNWNSSSLSRIWETSNNEIKLGYKGEFWINYSYKNCIRTDTFSIDYFQSESDSISIPHCFDKTPYAEINAPYAKEYLWQHNQSKNNISRVDSLGDYIVYIKTNNNCSDSILFQIKNGCQLEVYIPNVFTPNNDGLNDGFKPQTNKEIDGFEMQVYNRWGTKVYDTRISQPWNGNYMGDKVQNGVYFYQITIKEHSGVRHFENGTVTILR
jgi:gliding motility-associated-like protein